MPRLVIGSTIRGTIAPSSPSLCGTLAKARHDSEANQTRSTAGAAPLLDALPDRERQVIELRFGLCGHEPLTLPEAQRLRELG
jgi:DNA-directed RNA polymerase sigma subunit (sigma70/sigma32)